MSLKEFAGQLPDFAKDIRLNVGSLLNEPLVDDVHGGLGAKK